MIPMDNISSHTAVFSPWNPGFHPNLLWMTLGKNRSSTLEEQSRTLFHHNQQHLLDLSSHIRYIYKGMNPKWQKPCNLQQKVQELMDLVEKNGSKVQELYERCNMVFCGYGDYVPNIDEISWVEDILENIEAENVGINSSGDGTDDDDDNGLLVSGGKVEEITYIHIHECDRFSIGVFCFPAGARIPLHDHPEMVVLSRVLYGSVIVRAYDWVKTPNQRYGNCGLAKVVTDDHVMDGDSPPSVLFPTSGGNLHSFTALTPCAILDVLSPPYSDQKGRPATYYSVISIPCFEGVAILRERSIPKDLVVVGAPYLGPKLVLEDVQEEVEEDDDDCDNNESDDDDDDG